MSALLLLLVRLGGLLAAQDVGALPRLGVEQRLGPLRGGGPVLHRDVLLLLVAAPLLGETDALARLLLAHLRDSLRGLVAVRLGDAGEDVAEPLLVVDLERLPRRVRLHGVRGAVDHGAVIL